MTEEHLPIVKVCVHDQCRTRGSEALYQKLKAELYGEALVLEYPHCFDECDQGPNISVCGNILKGVTFERATERVRDELRQPSLKNDGPGTRSLDELDTVLDEATRL